MRVGVDEDVSDWILDLSDAVAEEVAAGASVWIAESLVRVPVPPESGCCGVSSSVSAAVDEEVSDWILEPLEVVTEEVEPGAPVWISEAFARVPVPLESGCCGMSSSVSVAEDEGLPECVFGSSEPEEAGEREAGASLWISGACRPDISTSCCLVEVDAKEEVSECDLLP